ncbi:hypothetical protein NL676_034248 [Syzygium grande]|nr:hypothetical protein NL676_034248 [Syzygium grande]
MANREAGTSSNGAAGDAGIRIFRDDEELRLGEVIGEELLRAIDDSILYIPIFSRGYATSKWDALLEHEKKVPEEVEAWRKALVEVDEIKGWNLNKDEGQGHLIKLVVEDVLEKLWISEEIVEILKTKEGKKQVWSLMKMAIKLKMIPILTGKGWKLPSVIGMLENLEEIHAERCEELEGEIPDEVGNLLLLRILNLSDHE